MTVLLVIATFAAFIALDYLVGLGRAVREERSVPEDRGFEPAFAPALAPWTAVEPAWVAGYRLPDDFSYHRGHTWVRPVAPDTVVVGVDDFAGQLIGTPDGVTLPVPGSRVHQGTESFRVHLGDREADLVSPVDGEVVGVNPALERDPTLLTDDPYGRGWVLKVRPSNLRRDLNNTLSGSLARRWTEDARERLELELMNLSGSVLSDGGEPVADFARHLDPEEWKRLVGEFLLT